MSSLSMHGARDLSNLRLRSDLTASTFQLYAVVLALGSYINVSRAAVDCLHSTSVKELNSKSHSSSITGPTEQTGILLASPGPGEGGVMKQ